MFSLGGNRERERETPPGGVSKHEARSGRSSQQPAFSRAALTLRDDAYVSQGWWRPSSHPDHDGS